MKAAIFSHGAVDTITLDGSRYEQIGGPACYCGITARQFGFDVDLATRIGPDFPVQYLTESGINLLHHESQKKTTRFSIEISGSERSMRLENRCDDIGYERIDADCHMVSPICGEISAETLQKIKSDASFLLVDPQGFLRQIDSQGRVSLKKADLDLSRISAIKVSPDESSQLAGGTHDEMMVQLQKKGAEYVLLTDKKQVSLLVKDKMYSITLPNKNIHDTTGVGDIFCSAFCCTMIKERDFLWALCFAGGAAQAALDSENVGLQKIPKKRTVQTNASYFYNLVKFRDL
ncbi:MAG: ribokinase [Nitrosopumilus sp. H8]|nr:MAG: ribokinase [Nitrosopumilus sp. H8]